jgi:cyclopropane fatty-acyl-phospholipid synthase-like methyltransferase
MTSYEASARFYDAVMGDRAELAAHLQRLIEQRCPGAQAVLEIACGTGSILEQLRPRYEVTGLDLSEEMLAIAAEKVPDVRLIQGDMTQFNLNEAFDVVLCVYDSINHLLNFAQWEQVFDRAREHLNDRGIFVFDINTELQLASHVEEPPWTHWFGDGHLFVMDVRDVGDDQVVWDIRIFEHVGHSNYRLHAEEIAEVSFPRSRIGASLRQRFARVSVLDQRRSRPTARSERLHFVCQK